VAVTLTESALSPESGSPTPDDSTVAVFVIVPADVIVPVMVNVAVAPSANVPMSHSPVTAL
jgi:hypothetical protein